MDAIARRVSRAEALASPGSGATAGIQGPATDEATTRDLVSAVESDLKTLEHLRDRIDRLADRAERIVDAPAHLG